MADKRFPTHFTARTADTIADDDKFMLSGLRYISRIELASNIQAASLNYDLYSSDQYTLGSDVVLTPDAILNGSGILTEGREGAAYITAPYMPNDVVKITGIKKLGAYIGVENPFSVWQFLNASGSHLSNGQVRYTDENPADVSISTSNANARFIRLIVRRERNAGTLFYWKGYDQTNLKIFNETTGALLYMRSKVFRKIGDYHTGISDHDPKVTDIHDQIKELVKRTMGDPFTYPTILNTAKQLEEFGLCYNTIAERMPDGSWIRVEMASYGSNEQDSCFIVVYKSVNDCLTWERIAILDNPEGVISEMHPNIHITTAGVIQLYVIAKVSNGPPYVRGIAKRVSTDGGYTWSSEHEPLTTLEEDPSYVSMICRKVFKLTNGTLLIPYGKLISGSGSSGESTYGGRMLMSTDDGATWTDSGVEISAATGNLVVEPGLYYDSDGNIVYYFRTLKGSIQAAKSVEDGDTFAFGSPYVLVGAPNSASDIKYIPVINKWMCVCNDIADSEVPYSYKYLLDRRNLVYYLSDTGDADSFVKQARKIARYEEDSILVFHPVIVVDEKMGGVFIFYSKYFNSPDQYIAKQTFLTYQQILNGY